MCREPGGFCLLPSAYRLLPTAFCLLPTAYCLLPSAFCLLPSAFCLLPSAYCLLPSAFCFLPSSFCLLLNGRLREPVLPAGCKPVGDTAKCPGRFDSEPGLFLHRFSQPALLFEFVSPSGFVTARGATCSKIAAQ